MKASELKIGNYLLKDGIVVKIDARTIFDIWDDEGLKKYEPIPLTEQWLLKFGFFIVETNNTIEASLPKFRYTVQTIEGYDGFLFCDGENVLTNLKYVDQLQNLYFVLTGEELTF